MRRLRGLSVGACTLIECKLVALEQQMDHDQRGKGGGTNAELIELFIDYCDRL